jgi:hypothetical protein
LPENWPSGMLCFGVFWPVQPSAPLKSYDLTAAAAITAVGLRKHVEQTALLGRIAVLWQSKILGVNLGHGVVWGGRARFRRKT